MTSSVTVASVTSEKKNFDVANHRLTTSVSGGSNFDEIRTKEVVSTTSKKEFNPSKMFQLISSQDNLFHKGLSECELVEAHHVPKNSELSVERRLEKRRSENKSLKEEIKKLKIEVEVAQVHSVVYHEMCCDTEALVADAYNQYDDLLSDLTQLLECIEKEMGENKHASSPEIATWIVRLKRKQRKPKRLTGFVYDEMKSWREPKKAKLNEIVPSVVNPAENDEIVDTTKGKAQIGSEAIGRHTVKGKQRIGITLDPSCMSVWMYLSNEEQDRMHQYFLCADSGVPFWKGSYSAVYKDDLRDLLTGSAITCNVIDTFGEILLAELGKEGRMKTISHIMTTYSWEYLQRGDGKSVGQFLFDPLLDVLSRVDYIIFPMRHHDQFHFTLLVLQKDEEQWVHYDPMRCVTDTSNDRCFADAEKLRDAVTMFLQYNSCIAPVMLNDGYRMRQSISEGERSIQSPLMQSEIQTLQWLISADPNYPLWPSLSCPRQLDGSLDCGIVVMYYMSTISRSQTMVKEFSVNKMKEYRAQIIRKYLSDAKCWEYE